MILTNKMGAIINPPSLLQNIFCLALIKSWIFFFLNFRLKANSTALFFK